MPIPTSRTAVASLNTCLAACNTQSSWTCGCSTKPSSGPSMPRRARLQKPAANPTARSVRSAMTPITAGYGRLPRWTRTMWPHGARAAGAQPRTAKCSASPTIGPKATENMGNRVSAHCGACVEKSAQDALTSSAHDGFLMFV
jgi:hypothetical protein